MSLVILLILTILGIAAMNTSSLEERMAGNLQESTMAFEAAESALQRSLQTGQAALNLEQPTELSYTFDFTSSSDTEGEVVTTFEQFSPPRRGTGYGAANFDAANFGQRSIGTAGGGARTVINRGVAQIVPKSQ